MEVEVAYTRNGEVNLAYYVLGDGPPPLLTDLAAAHPDVDLRPRVGTKLWLSDHDACRALAHVVDVHPVRRGDRFGYRQRRVPGDGHLVVVSGGTAHGIALEAPSHVGNLRARARALAASGLLAVMNVHRGDIPQAAAAIATAEAEVARSGPQLGIDQMLWGRALLHEARGDVVGAWLRFESARRSFMQDDDVR